MLWLKHGDLNTRVFHNMARVHSHKNRISSIFDNLGNVISNQDDFEKCFMDFFYYLWLSRIRWSFQDLFRALPQEHNNIYGDDRLSLTQPVSYREILFTIKSMAKGKSPGPGDLNVQCVGFLAYFTVQCVLQNHFKNFNEPAQACYL